MADDDWYKPNPKPTPPRQLKPGKHVWTLVKAGRRFDCELRFQGESYGWECQLLEDGEIRFGWRFPLHQAQPPKPKCSAGIPAGRLEGSGDEPSSGLRAVKRGKGDEYRLGKGVHHRPARRGRGVSGAKDRRAALDRLLADARRRRFDVVVVWRLDRLGRNLRHLIVLLEELQALGIAFVSLGEGIDATTPAGKLQMHILGAIAEFERARIAERVRAGLQRARAQGERLGRPRKVASAIIVPGGSVREAARVWGVSKSTAARWIAAGKTPAGQSSPAA